VELKYKKSFEVAECNFKSQNLGFNAIAWGIQVLFLITPEIRVK
jgi:hypothetical protein